MPHQDTVRT